MNLLLEIALLSVCLFVATLLMTTLPLLVKMSKQTLKVINLVGVGLMLGTAFVVVVPEAMNPGCECGLKETKEAAKQVVTNHIEAKNIGLAVAIGFLCMMIGDSLSHGSSEDHHHGDNEACEAKEEVAIVKSDTTLTELKATILGLCLHSIFDGITIGSSVASSNETVMRTMFFAILLHKLASSIGTGIYIKNMHLSLNQVHRYIALFSAATPLSTIISAVFLYFGSSLFSSSILAYAFAFSAGTYLHVALMHILPSIGHHIGVVQVITILIGILVPYFLFMDHHH